MAQSSKKGHPDISIQEMIDEANLPLSQAHPYLINRLARLLRLHLLGMVSDNEWDITPEQYLILLKIYQAKHNTEFNGLAPIALADPVLKDYPNITRLVDALVKKDLLQRFENDVDRRMRHVMLTREGEALVKSMLPVRKNELKSLMKGFSPSESKQFLSYLQRMEENLTEHLER